MKRFFLFSVLLLATIVIMAEGIDRQSALEKAKKFMPGKQFVAAETVPSARRAIANKTDAFYVFNAEDNAGYVIVSGDDRTTEILGYAENGNLDIDHIPDNMKWWLDNYARQIKALGTSLSPAKSGLGMRRAAAIQPLIQSKWGQGAPYNYMCPDGDLVDYYEAGYNTNNRCPTGCVATAMAQIMYYWKWPESCPALSDYSKSWSYGGTTTTWVVKGLPATTFKWDKMKDSYTVYDEDDESAMAVAELMRYCGQAVEMGYGGPSGSAAHIYKEMASVFNYSVNSHTLSRDGYTAGQWEGIIYEELAAHRPVLYSGIPVDLVGHQFIIDGYDGNGLFHINWGWGGSPDNYYVLSIADPNSPGKTTVSTDLAFDMEQIAWVGVKPAEKDEVELPSVRCHIGEHLVSTYVRNSSADNFVNVTLNGYLSFFYNLVSEGNIEVGWALYQGDTFIKCLDSRKLTSQSYNVSQQNNKMTVTFGADLAEGIYHLYQIYRCDGETEWRLCGHYGIESLTADITSTSLTLRKPNPEKMAFEVLSINVPDDAEAGNDLNIQVNVKNTGRTNYLSIGLWAQKQGESEWKNTAVSTIFLYGKGSTGEATLTYIPEEGGTYQLKITAGETDEALITSSVNIASTVKQVVDGVTYLCSPKFGRAKVIRNDNIPHNLTSVNILSSIKVDEVECKVKTIGDYAFDDWWNLKSVTISEGIEEIGSHAFHNCQRVTSLILPEGLEVIGEEAFSGMSLLPELVLPSTLKIIDRSAFGGLKSIKTLVIPEGVEKLEIAVFWHMNNLTRLELPGSLKFIGNQIVQGCSKLEHIFSHTDHPITVGEYTFWDAENHTYPQATLYVPIGAKANYEAIPGWTTFAAIVESEDVRHGTVNKYKLTYMVDGAEYKSYEVEYGATITPEAAPTKEGYTFSGWSEIPSTMPAHDVTVTGTFSVNKYKLTYKVDGTEYKSYDVEFGATITPETAPTKEGHTFSGWSEIPSTMPAHDVTVTGTFSVNKYKLTYKVDGAEYKSYDVEFGATITPETAPTKEGYTFSGWSEIPATMPAHDVTIIGTFTQIDYVVGETTYEIQNDEVSVKDGSKLSGNVEIQTTVVINDQTYKVTSIADNAFKGNTAITSVTIPNSITQIGTNVFEGCTSLSEINIGNAVSSIGSKAFANITSASNAPRRAGTGLKVSCYAENVPSTASNAFENTSISNGTLLVEDNSVTAYKNSAPWNGFGTVMGFKEATGIEKIWSDENGKAKIFSIDGKPINTPQKGAVIIRMNNGETRKVVVK